MTVSRLQLVTYLNASGEKELMKEFLRMRLSETGWREEMQSRTKDQLDKKLSKSTSGQLKDSDVTQEWIVKDLLPNAIESIPASVRAEVLTRIKAFLIQDQHDVQ